MEATTSDAHAAIAIATSGPPKMRNGSDAQVADSPTSTPASHRSMPPRTHGAPLLMLMTLAPCLAAVLMPLASGRV